MSKQVSDRMHIWTISCKAAPLSAAVTELSRHMPASEASMYTGCSRWSPLPYCTISGESITNRGRSLIHSCLGLRRRRPGVGDTRRGPSRHPQTRLRRRRAGNASYGQTSHQSNTMYMCADGGAMATTESTAG